MGEKDKSWVKLEPTLFNRKDLTIAQMIKLSKKLRRKPKLDKK